MSNEMDLIMGDLSKAITEAKEKMNRTDHVCGSTNLQEYSAHMDELNTVLDGLKTHYNLQKKDIETLEV